MEEITCLSSDKQLKVLISTVNRPDFDLGKFDSQDDAGNNGVVTFQIEYKGSPIDARVVGLASLDGTTTPIEDVGSNGKPCVSGSKVTGIQVAARITATASTRSIFSGVTT